MRTHSISVVAWCFVMTATAAHAQVTTPTVLPPFDVQELQNTLTRLDNMPQGEPPVIMLSVPFRLDAIHPDADEIMLRCFVVQELTVLGQNPIPEDPIAQGYSRFPAGSPAQLSGAADIPIFLTPSHEVDEVYGSPYLCLLALELVNDGGYCWAKTQSRIPGWRNPHCDARNDRPKSTYLPKRPEVDYSEIGVTGTVPGRP